ncbi:uncharacterized protein YutE (UPF0331/DUF86 family) [Naumannella cuiyingiana]|uniref:Uncharacterized protein YutE (UPF0331/DUF86 family) n=1 Tax=Naumannella cuiyingiana TaxID=1347891 RepID=A0A7Z0DAI8_9ACTN|nr:uncharacterized protein YutE (UPF0331/DUF86 family) [Naumannella cuiyingiana]
MSDQTDDGRTAKVLEQFGGQPWRLIVGMRNFAVHQYDDLDPRRVWRTATPFPMFRLVICEWMS